MLILLQKNFMQFLTQEQKKKNKQREELEKSKNQNMLD